MKSVYPCMAGIDVHKKMLAVVIRRQCGEQADYQKRKFGTTRAEIQHWEAWLRAQGVSEVVVESTAQYWRPVWYGLEPHFKLHLTHPLQTRAPRKEVGFPRCAALGRPVVFGRSGGELHTGCGAAELALADQNTGAVEEETERNSQSGGRAAGTRRNQIGGRGKRLIRRQWLGHAGTHR